jgi:hypothetical protein
MTPESWQQVKDVLQQVLEQAPSERSAFLDRACEGDEPLRREVASSLLTIPPLLSANCPTAGCK